MSSPSGRISEFGARSALNGQAPIVGPRIPVGPLPDFAPECDYGKVGLETQMQTLPLHDKPPMQSCDLSMSLQASSALVATTRSPSTAHTHVGTSFGPSAHVYPRSSRGGRGGSSHVRDSSTAARAVK